MNTERDKLQLARLAERLSDATAGKRIEWRAPEPDAYEWAAADGIVSVASKDRDGQPPFELSVFNSQRQKLDDLRSELLANDQPAPWNAALADLYSVARRSALRADDVIEALMNALRGSDSDEETHQERSFLSRALRTDSDA
jgi:hypothetical protein